MLGKRPCRIDIIGGEEEIIREIYLPNAITIL